jgi:uncharacterized protein YceK
MKRLLLSLAVALSVPGCSIIRSNIPASTPLIECPEYSDSAMFWSSMDALTMLATVSLGASFQSNMWKIEEHQRVSIPLFMVSTVFFVSMISGIGEYTKCHR